MVYWMGRCCAGRYLVERGLLAPLSVVVRITNTAKQASKFPCHCEAGESPPWQSPQESTDNFRCSVTSKIQDVQC